MFGSSADDILRAITRIYKIRRKEILKVQKTEQEIQIRETRNSGKSALKGCKKTYYQNQHLNATQSENETEVIVRKGGKTFLEES